MTYEAVSGENIIAIGASLNDASNGFFGFILIAIVWTMLFVIAKLWSTEDSMLFSLLATTMFGMVFAAAGWVSWAVIVVLMGWTFALLLFTFRS